MPIGNARWFSSRLRTTSARFSRLCIKATQGVATLQTRDTRTVENVTESRNASYTVDRHYSRDSSVTKILDLAGVIFDLSSHPEPFANLSDDVYEWSGVSITLTVVCRWPRYLDKSDENQWFLYELRYVIIGHYHQGKNKHATNKRMRFLTKTYIHNLL